MPSPDAVRAWHAAIQVAVRTRSLAARLPKRGYADLRDQMIRAAESIGHNIAEGRGSAFEREYIRFLDMAARSANELSSQLTEVMAYDVVPRREVFNLNGTVICTRKMVESLRETVQRNYQMKGAHERAERGRKPSPRARKTKGQS